jgi:hypothetical protein
VRLTPTITLTPLVEIKLEQSESLPQKTQQTKRNKKQNEVKPFDLDDHMKNYSRTKDQLVTKDNDDIQQQLLLITINRYDDNERNINNQQIEFSNTITAPNTESIQVQYKLVGYVLFTGDKTSGHYRAICRGNDDHWFLYNDDDTAELNVKARANHIKVK